MEGVFVLGVLAFIYVVLYRLGGESKAELKEKRIAILECLNRLPRYSYFDRSKLVDELSDIDLKLAGGCKKKWGFITCSTCDIRRCPRHSQADFYERLNPRFYSPDCPLD